MDQPGKSNESTNIMEDYARCYIYLHHLWKDDKKIFSKSLQENLANATNPYKLALVCIKLCPDLYINKSSAMAANIVVGLQTFLNECKGGYEGCLTEVMQEEVFLVAVKQKNTGMMRLLVEAYQLRDVVELLLPKLHTMVEQEQYKDVCILATLLNLQEHFTTLKLIVPLFCSDRLYLADTFLDSSPPHQKEIIMFIDSVIGKQPEAYSILERFNITDVSRFKSSKVLSNMLGRILKRYQLDVSFCPHLYKRRAVGGLRYLFYKYYVEKGLQTASFHSLVEDAVKETPDLKWNLLELFCEYCDPNSAVPYVAKFQLSTEELPLQIRDSVSAAPPSEQGNIRQKATEIPKEDCWDLEEKESYSLSIPLENIIFVDTVQDLEKCIQVLSESSVIAFDSEWKPTFGIGTPEKVALMQLGTLTHVYLIDILTLQPLLEKCHWTWLGHLFTDANITKLGYGIKCDLKILAKLHSDFKKALATAKNVIDFDQKKAMFLEAKPDIFSFSSSSYKGLSDFVYRCFGTPLNKNEQFSNWSSRPLSRSQKLYAALDARCLIDIYNYLNAKAQELSIDDWRNLKLETSEKKRMNLKRNKNVEPTPNKFSLVEKRSGPISAKDFLVVCDTMLQGLAKKLRLCGVDAVALENGQSPDDCIDYFEKERRVVLSKGAAFKRLFKFVPSEYIYHVETEGARRQLTEVMEAFQVTLSPEDLFARCTKCNSGSYVTVPPSVITTIKENENKSDTVPDEWTAYQGGKINLSSGVTESGVKIKLEKVLTVIDKAIEIYICAQCGKCYWEGSHQERAFRDIITQFIHQRDCDVKLMVEPLQFGEGDSCYSDEEPDSAMCSGNVSELLVMKFNDPDVRSDVKATSLYEVESSVDKLSISG